MIFLCLICVTWLFVVDALHVGSILGKKWLAVSTSAVMASWLQLHAPILLIDNVQIYDSVASTYDSLDNGYLPEALGLNKLRDKAGSLVQGAVLEVGVGTGIQLSHYKWDQIESFTGLDASNGMLSEASNKVINIQESYPKVNLQFVQSNAEDMAMLPTQQQVRSFANDLISVLIVKYND